MLRVVILRAIFISSCILHIGCQSGDRPRLLNEKSADTKSVNIGDHFQLECESNRPVYWTYPNIEKHRVNNENVVNITNSKQYFRPYRSVLSRNSARFLDTGNYSCIVNGTPSNDIDNAATIYVYVKGCENEVCHGQPQLLFETLDSKQIDAGDSLKLECESDRPIYWTYPNLELHRDPNTVSLEDTVININEYETSTGQYRSVLSLTNTNYLDTGNYSCRVNETTDGTVDNAASIYVYVKDVTNLFVKNDTFVVVPAKQYQSAVLPCRPSSPEVSVTLTKDGSDIPLGIQESDYMNVTFDPKFGFTLNPIDIKDGGFFICVAEFEDESSQLFCHMEVLKASSFIPKPVINGSAPHPVVAGGALRLECIGMATKGIKFSFKWFGPKKQEIFKDNRTDIADPLPHKKCGKNTYVCHMSSLTISDVTMSDAGSYTCLVLDHNGNMNNDTQPIKVHEPGDDYINLTAEEVNFNVSANMPNVTWMISVDASSRPEFKWHNPKGEEITQNSKSDYKMEISKGFQRIMLVIHDIQVDKAGTYEFIAFNGNSSKSLNLTLTVKEKPTVKIEGDTEIYYQLGQKYTKECEILGYPPPELKWSFLDCDFMSKCDEDNFQTVKNVSDLELYKKAYPYNSSYTWTVTNPGKLKCYAENSEGSGSDTINILVKDFPNEDLSIWGKPEKVVEGDTITLSCGAVRYNFSDDVSWYYRRVGYDAKSPVNNSERQYVVRTDTLYSYRAELTLVNVTFGSDANYTCVARRNEDGVNEMREEVINVLASKKPTIISTNMNASEMLENTENPIKMHCEADGLPAPTVKWYKNNAELYNNTRISVEGHKLVIQFPKFDDEGDYKCVVSNRIGTVSKSMSLKFKDKPGVNLGLVIGIVVCVFVLMIMIIILIVKIFKEKKLRKELNVAGLSNFVEGAMENINPELPVDDQAELLPYDKKWEFPRDKLKLGKQLGSGAFGVVMKGEAWGVIEGELKSTVAVKMVKRNADRTYIKALASELKIMIHLGKHLNVVNLLGACTKNLAKMELLVIVEYCRFGNLHNYLLRHREEFVDQIDPRTGEIDPSIGTEILSRTESFRSNSKLKYASLSFSNSSGARSDSGGGMPVDYRAACSADPANRTSDSLGMDTEMNLISLTPTGEHDEFILSNNSVQPEWRSNYRGDYKGARPICTRDLLCWAFQVARGMEYLASRKVLHGDLAARNILLADDNIVKICDFGLAKSMYKSDNYHKKGDGPLPVKWMAVESIRDRVFSTQSDVWSFGIVLWEFFSLARTPYPGMEADEKLYNRLAGGYRMEKPQYSTADIYGVMMKCWEARPINRPCFSELTERLGSMLEESVRRHYIDLNDPYMDMNAQWLQGLENDYLSMMNAPTYGNMVSPSRVDDDDHEYVNSPHRVESTSEGGEGSGYLCMKSPSPEDVIFSPRRKETNIFRFSPHLQNQRRQKNAEAEGAQKPEQKPMLSTSRNSSESDIELDVMEKGSSKKEEDKESETKDSEKTELPSFSNPSYQSVIPIMPSDDNYVNMPQQKKSKYDKIKNSESQSTNTDYSNCVPGPNELTTGEQSKFQNSYSNPNYQSQVKSQDPYVNVPNHSRRISDASSGFQSDVGESLLVN